MQDSQGRRIEATAAASEALRQLQAEHGQLILHIPGGAEMPGSGRELSRDSSTALMLADGSSAKISAGVHSASDVVIRPVPAPISRMLRRTPASSGGSFCRISGTCPLSENKS